jgi:hypothetical protein
VARDSGIPFSSAKGTAGYNTELDVRPPTTFSNFERASDA